MRIRNKTTPAVSFSILSSILVLAFMSIDEFYVAAPVLACVIMMVWLWLTLWDRDKKIPFFDVGVFCALATLVYTVYPLVNYWMNGLHFGILSDNRLWVYNPSPAELGIFHLRHVLYFYSFVFSYSMFRGSGNIKVGNVNTPSHSAHHVIILFFLLLTGFLIFFQAMTGVDFNVSYESEAYHKNLAAFSRVPLFLLQISTKLRGIYFIFKLSLLFFVVSRCRKKKWLIVLMVWVAVEIVQVSYIRGARTEFVLFLMATALLYHRMIKPFTMKFIITAGAMLFAGFIFLGVYRSYYSFNEMWANIFLYGGILSSSNEFQALLGTAYDVNLMKEAGTIFPWYLYLNDIITILPPQQFLPFKKVPATEWYLREIGLSGTGYGLMWGVISQSIVGLDWFEIALRGAFLGFILGKFHRWYLKHQSGFLETMVYIFFCLKVYYTFRDTTLSLLANLVWEVIPFYILLRIGVTFLSRNPGADPILRIALSSRDIK